MPRYIMPDQRMITTSSIWMNGMITLRESSTFGMWYCLLAPFAYPAYNLCLRQVSNQHDSAWIACVQASVGMLVFGVYLIWQGNSNRQWPAWPLCSVRESAMDRSESKRYSQAVANGSLNRGPISGTLTMRDETIVVLC
jgi:hypothetical protein